jgi:predicted transcriptional regulator
MAKKDKLTEVSVKVGTALGKVNKRARKVASAGVVAKEELKDIAREIESLKKQLTKTSDRLRKALVS